MKIAPQPYTSEEIDALFRQAQLDDQREMQEIYGVHPEHAPAPVALAALDEDDELDMG